MEGVELLEAALEQVEYRLVARESPVATVVVARGCFGGETFDNDVGSQSLKHRDKEVDILLETPKGKVVGV